MQQVIIMNFWTTQSSHRVIAFHSSWGRSRTKHYLHRPFYSVTCTNTVVWGSIPSSTTTTQESTALYRYCRCEKSYKDDFAYHDDTGKSIVASWGHAIGNKVCRKMACVWPKGRYTMKQHTKLAHTFSYNIGIDWHQNTHIKRSTKLQKDYLTAKQDTDQERSRIRSNTFDRKF